MDVVLLQKNFSMSNPSEEDNYVSRVKIRVMARKGSMDFFIDMTVYKKEVDR